MRSRTAMALVVALALALPSSTWAGEPAGLTLEDCEQRAASAHPEVRAARHAVEMAQARADARFWAWFPDIDFLGYATVAPGTSGDDTEFDDWGAYFRVEIRGEMPLYTFGAMSAREAEAGRKVDAAHARVAREIQKAAYEVRKAWQDHALACANEKVLQLGIDRVELIMARLDEMDEEDDPDLDPIDRLRVRVQQAELRVQHRGAQRARLLALARLRRLLGMEPDAELELAKRCLEPTLGVLAPLEEYGILARMFSPRLRAGRDEQLAARELLRASERSMLPEFFLGGLFRYGYRGASEPELSPFASDRDNSWDFAAFLGIRVPLDVPQGLARRDVAAARLQYRARVQERDRQEIALRVARRYGEVEDVLSRLPSLRDAAKAARSWYDARATAYDLEMASVGETLKALSAAVQRQVALSGAIRDLNVAVAALSREVGVDVELLTPGEDGGELPPGLRLPPGFRIPEGIRPELRERLRRRIEGEGSP